MVRRRGGNIGRVAPTSSGLVEPSDVQTQPEEQPIIQPSNTLESELLNPTEVTETSSLNDHENSIPVFDDSIPVFETSTPENGYGGSPSPEISTEQFPVSSTRSEEDEYASSAVDDIDRDHLRNVNILERRGNYLLSIGLPSSGKTVLQSFMTYYMNVSGKLSAKLDNKEPKTGLINHEAQLLQTLWLDSWKKGDFPPGTPLAENQIRELRLQVTNQENKGQNFNFSFLEISGENFKNVVPTERNIPKLFERIKLFLSNKRINLNFAFVLKTDEIVEEASNDALFTNFLTFIETELSLDISKKVGLVLVIPNPKAVFGETNWKRTRLSSKKDRQFFDKLIKDYIYENFPATYQIYNNWNPKKRALLAFHIGDETDGRLINQDYADVNGLINLNYQFFTGKMLHPKKTLIQRIFGM